MIRVTKMISLFVCTISAVLFSVSLSAKDPDFMMIELDQVSRYTEDKVAYQQVQKFIDPLKDDSLATLLIIRKGKMYLIKDGYDNPQDVFNARQKVQRENVNYEEADLWKNKINGKPDYIRVTDRREELTKNFDETYVSTNFGAIYLKARNQLLTEHVQNFYKLMRDRRESGLTVSREILPPVKGDKAPRYFTSATAKTNEGWVYYAEDSDGDGVTETFSVNIPDNFHWGYKSGPNVIFIYKNSDADVQKSIGDLAKNAYFGTPEEAKTIVDTFPKDIDIENIIKRK